jgi:DNA repair protein RecO (recombination protein O)
MSLVTTPAIVLHSFRYGETSKIVRLLTLDIGLQSVVAKGAMRPKSKFGASLEVMSEGAAHIYVKDNRELHTLGEFEVNIMRRELAGNMDRFAVAAVMAELVIKFGSSEPHHSLYVFLHTALNKICGSSGDSLTVEGLLSIWGIIRELGFAPALFECAVDGRPVNTGDAPFSVSEGGFLCEACAAGRLTARVPVAERDFIAAALEDSVDGSLVLEEKTAAAHRRLVARFIHHHLAEGREMKALDYWEAL